MCECGGERRSSSSATAAVDVENRWTRQQGGEKAPKSAWRSSPPVASAKTAEGRGAGETTHAAAGGADSERPLQREQRRSTIAPSWVDMGVEAGVWAGAGGSLLSGLFSALHLRGGVKAMSATGAAAAAGGGGKGGRGKSIKEAGKQGGTGGGGGQGKSVPLAGRPLFTSVASTKVTRARREGCLRCYQYV